MSPEFIIDNSKRAQNKDWFSPQFSCHRYYMDFYSWAKLSLIKNFDRKKSFDVAVFYPRVI